MRYLAILLALLIAVPAYGQALLFPQARRVRAGMKVVSLAATTGCGGSLSVTTGNAISFTGAVAASDLCTNGTYVSAAANNPVISDKGAQVLGGFTQYATTTEAFGSMTVVGTPTPITANNWTWPGGATGDTITDDDAGASEGVQFANVTSGGLTGQWTASCWLGSGTATSARIQITTDGTGTASCSKTGLTTTAVRWTCTGTIGGSPTNVKARLVVGSGNPDTGTITGSGCQMVKGASALPYVPNTGASALVVPAVVPTMTSAAKGKTCWTVDENAPWDTAQRDLWALGSGNNSLVAYYNTTDGLGLIVTDGSGGLKTWKAASSWTTNTQHTATICYDPGTGAVVMAIDGGAVTPSATGAGTGLVTYASTRTIGCANDGTSSIGASSVGYFSRTKTCTGTNVPAVCN